MRKKILLAHRRKFRICTSCSAQGSIEDGTFTGGFICAACIKARSKIASSKYRKRYRAMRYLILRHYGNSCDCCEEDSKEFLTISYGRSSKLGSSDLYRTIIKNDFPDHCRILCMNCNWSRRTHGYCPHDSQE